MQVEFRHYKMESAARQVYDLRMALNLNIRTIRKQRGMTIAQLAEVIGVSTPHLSEVERGKKNVNNHLLLRLSDALGVAPEDLIATEDGREALRLIRAVEQLSSEDRQRVEDFARALLQSQRETQRT